MTDTIAPAQVWLGACVGAQVLLVFLSVIQANAYRERSLLLHGAATLMAVVAVESVIGDNAALPAAMILFVPALAGLQLMALVGNAGSLHAIRRWLAAVVSPSLSLTGCDSPTRGLRPPRPQHSAC